MSRRIHILFILLAALSAHAQINFNFTATTGTYAYNSGTNLTNLGASVDEAISPSTSIGFTFQFGCTNYTTFQASSNGVLYLGTALASAPANTIPNLSGSTNRPIIAPLWDDLATSSTGNVNYKLAGTSPNRILTVEWLNMKWDWGASGKVISFQVMLYEGTNQIDFIYKIENIANLNSATAAIGLAGSTSGDYYSLNNSGTSPTASKTAETDNISTAPATNQIYRWNPVICSGTPSGITPSVSPASVCAPGTATLSLSGATACGLTYQWQSSSTGTGGWSNISGATSSTQTVTVPSGGSFYQCVVTCASSGLSSTTTTLYAGVGSPSNDNCSGATPLTMYDCTPGDVTCATQSQAGCLGTANDDVWYSFTATSTSHYISISASSSFDPVVQVFSGSCGSLTSLWCDDATFTTGGSLKCKGATGLTIVNTYYVRVYDFGTGVPATTTFTICVTSGTASVCNLNYTYTSITNTQDAGVTNTVSLSDDHLSSALALPFGFCFDGFLYSQVYVSSNAALVFDAVDPCVPNVSKPRVAAANGGYTGYSISGPIPTTTDYAPQNAILAPWHDIDPAHGGTITYATLGTAPNRRFVVSFNAVKQFYSGSPCQNTSYDYTGQVKLYETSYDIEIHVQQMNSCTSWNNGQAILGLHNAYGTAAVVPAGYNANASSPYNVYSISNAAWRFSTTCTSCNIVLPVELLEFTASKLSDNYNELRWTTASEKNVKWFHIERSQDGRSFSEVTKVKANKPNGGAYDHADPVEDPYQSYYYRLVTEDVDGKVEYSGIRLVRRDRNTLAGVLTVYPNPFASVINVDLESLGENEVKMEVFDMLGKKVYDKSVILEDGTNTAQIGDFGGRQGLYLLRVTDAGGAVLLNRKMIRE